jgi:hypothetical protein
MLTNSLPVGASIGRGGRFKVCERSENVAESAPEKIRMKQNRPQKFAAIPAMKRQACILPDSRRLLTHKQAAKTGSGLVQPKTLPAKFVCYIRRNEFRKLSRAARHYR